MEEIQRDLQDYIEEIQSQNGKLLIFCNSCHINLSMNLRQWCCLIIKKYFKRLGYIVLQCLFLGPFYLLFIFIYFLKN